MYVSAQTIQLDTWGRRPCVRLFRGAGDRLRSIQINDWPRWRGRFTGPINARRLPYTWRYLPWHSC